MDKITTNDPRSKSADLVADNLARLAQLFPETVKEGKVDKDALLDLIGDTDDTPDERFCLNWAGKAQARREAQKQSLGTLRPCPAESVDWDTTQNVYIEGDNLEVLKLLQKSYHAQVKMIYIDPPYNTGKDFVYKDDYNDNIKNYLKLTGQDRSLGTNTESDGRYHSNWLNMMYPRLKLARNLLRDDGVIFISIDDHEVAQLRKLCDEIFGEDNFVAQIIWERAFAPVNLMKHFSTSHDYALCYSKNIEEAVCNGIRRTDTANERYQNPDNDIRGVWSSSDISVGPAVQANIYPITTPSGRVVEPPAGRSWSLSKKAFFERLQDNRIWFGSDGDGVPRIKRFLSDLRKEGITPMTIWKYVDVGHSQEATKALKELFDGQNLLDYPKPIAYIKRMLELYTASDSLILDFFSGSATTAHAVMQLNAEDEGRRKYIMVQLPEPCPEGSEAATAGYKNICEIGKERIRRAGRKVLSLPVVSPQLPIDFSENRELTTDHYSLDTGFRVYKLDSSNINAWDDTPENLEPSLDNALDNIKQGRSEEDVLYEILIKYGLPLTEQVTKHDIAGHAVYEVGAGTLIVCLSDRGINIDTAEGIGELWESVRPEGEGVKCNVVFRDSGFDSDTDKTNVLLTLKQHGILNVASI
ncbi:MAG: site-specific DNA-methyltransferase [Tannerella sp.]|jgi:adenine-specific DNA-methyltransferase|nr:site-specific DNA-methyltransferase [Tannerella sp.]